jgi:hypothetical protein
MATNNELLNKMAVDIAIIKQAIEPLPQMFKDMYIGDNEDPPITKTCRDYLADKKATTLAKKDCEADKKDDKKWLKRTAWGALITGVISSLIGIAILFIKLLPILEAIK